MSNPIALTKEPKQAAPQFGAVAPVWHTCVVVVLLAALAALAFFRTGREDSGHAFSKVFGHLIIMASEWLIVSFIALGARWRGSSLLSLVGGSWLSWRFVVRDLGIAIAYLAVANPILGFLAIFIGRVTHAAPTNSGLQHLLPHTGLESAVYLLLALSAGFCEELIHRGYLQRQFTAWTGNAGIGIALQGIVFGAAHAYQGPILMLIIGIYGSMFGRLSWWRKSLRPGMAAHVMQDAIGGLVLARFM